MLKKFVPLNSNASPSKNPHEVRTYMGDPSAEPEWRPELCSSERKCNVANNSTISKVLTIEDELRRLHQKAKESRFARPFKKKCDHFDDFTMCIVPQRTPRELKVHARMREHLLRTQSMLGHRVHNAAEPKAETPELVQLDSPMAVASEEDGGEEAEPTTVGDNEHGEEEGEEGETEPKKVKPKLASPSCSMDVIYKPPSKLLELKRPKSRMYINESEPPLLEDNNVQYSTYNPREIQERFHEQDLPRFDLIEGRDEQDLWTWNIGLQKRDSELDEEFHKATMPSFDCDNMELRMFQIPQDLSKTFNAEIVFGNESLLPEPAKDKIGYFNRPKEVACLFVAYVESFRMNPDFWTAETMDAILGSGQKLLAKSIALNYKSKENDYDIYSQIVEKQASIGLKVHYTGPLKEEPNIFKALALYFSKFNAVMLCSKNLYLLIWKRCQNSFYIFDPYGRNEICQRDFENGKCSLMATRYVEHLVHLIMNFSEADLEADFNLYEIFLTNYGKITNPLSTKVQPKLTRKLWAVVNNTYAIIPGTNNGLQQPITGNEPNPSMVIALLALLYSDIERASLWRMEVVDDLVKFGQNYYKTFAKRLKLRRTQNLNIADLPELIMMGAFKASLKKGPFLYTGHVVNCHHHRDSQVTLALRELFTSKWEAALMQVDNSVIAVWRDREFFYVFDPFRRGKAGQVLEPEDFLTKGVACLQLHTDFDSLCRILYLKALKMRRGGKFFLHGVKVGCIKPLVSAMTVKTKYTRLRLTYPKLDTVEVERPARPKQEKDGKKDGKRGGGASKKKGKPERTFSIHSVPETDRIPEFEEADVVDAVLEEALCEILQRLPEPRQKRPVLHKQADKVLFRSDKSYLEKLQYDMQHGQDYDNLYEEYRIRPEPPPQPLTVEEELLVPSNYEYLPDGSWILFGTSQLPLAPDEEAAKLSGLLACLVAAAVSAKYNIATWNAELVEYALQSAQGFGEDYQSYEKTLALVVGRRIPNVSLGHSRYRLKVAKVTRSTVSRSLRQVLLESVISHNRMLVICQRFSCLIVKRYNFLYMFVGFPCTAVGYRKYGPGPGCVLRFVVLDSLLRRIELGCNPQGCEVTNYVVVALKLVDITDEPPERFRRWPDSDEEAMCMHEMAEQSRQRQRKLDKIRFLDEELCKENQRIKDFLAEKERRLEERRLAAEMRRNRKRPMQSKKTQHTPKGDGRGRGRSRSGDGEEEDDDEELLDDEGEYEEEGEEEEDDEVPLKHKPGTRLRRPIERRFTPRPVLYGYRLREKDCLFKIQGSTALEGRDVATLDEIKPCFFASALAILYAILRPLNQWSLQRIDRVIENATLIAAQANMTTAFKRDVRNVIVDDYVFDIWTRIFEPKGVWGFSVDRKLSKATHTKRYLMLQTANATYAIYRDDYYHLFDPYASMETLQGGSEEEEEEEEQKPEEDEEDEDEEADEGQPRSSRPKCPRGMKRYGERNTASWVLFADVDSLLKYVDQRTSNPDWKEANEYKLHIVDVGSYRKASAKTRMLQLLTDLSVPVDCPAAARYRGEYEEETAICAHAETLSWLDLQNCLPVWSRMNRRNTVGRYRNLPVTKLKKYDIEIDGRLWSLWGTLHPQAPVFDPASRGKQFLACNVVACCAATVYRLTDWSSQLLDTIVISGDRYHRDSVANIKRQDYEFSLEDLNIECTLENIKFVVHVEHVAYGKLYAHSTRARMNLADALTYFFSHFQFGIVQCHSRSLAVGRVLGYDGGYFMYDCQSREHPLFPKGQGASYLLRTRHLQVLLYCIVITLNVPYYNMEFTLHKVNMLREGTSVDDDEAEEEEEEEAGGN